MHIQKDEENEDDDNFLYKNSIKHTQKLPSNELRNYFVFFVQKFLSFKFQALNLFNILRKILFCLFDGDSPLGKFFFPGFFFLVNSVVYFGI